MGAFYWSVHPIFCVTYHFGSFGRDRFPLIIWSRVCKPCNVLNVQYVHGIRPQESVSNWSAWENFEIGPISRWQQVMNNGVPSVSAYYWQKIWIDFLPNVWSSCLRTATVAWLARLRNRCPIGVVFSNFSSLLLPRHLDRR